MTKFHIKINFCIIGILLALLTYFCLGSVKSTRAAGIHANQPPQSGSNSTPLVLTLTPTETQTSTPTQTNIPTLTETGTPTPTGTDTPTAETPTSTGTPTQVETITPTPSLAPTEALNNLDSVFEIHGVVIASKPITVTLFSGASMIQSVAADTHGAFSLSAPSGSYTLIASAPGFLDVQGTVTLDGSIATMPTTELVPGDLNGDKQINQLDLLSIGINYNKASPEAADLNNDGIINVLDLQIISIRYPLSGPTGW